MTAGASPRRICLALLFVASFVCTTPAVSLAEIKGAEDRKGFTQHDYRKAALDFYRRMLGDAYKKVGHRDDRWNAQTEAFLESAAVYFAYHGAAEVYDEMTPLTPGEFARAGHAILALGCDDPMIQFCVFVAHRDADQMGEAFTYLHQASAGIVKSDYPAIPKCIVSGTDLTYMRERLAPDVKAMRAQAIAQAVLAANFEKPLDRRLVYEAIWKRLYDKQSNMLEFKFAKDSYDTAMAQKDADPWLAEMIAGDFYLLGGSQALREGDPNVVTEDEKEAYHAGIAESRQHFEAAMALEPDYPEAATRMIVLATRYGTPHSTPRDWFDEATIAQFDYPAAYTTMIEWMGIPDLYAFGQECLGTARYDTDVPAKLIEAIDFAAFRQQDVKCWGEPGVYDDVRKLCTDIGSKWPTRGKARFGSLLAAAAWYVDEWADVRQALDAVGDDFDPTRLIQFGGLPARAMSEAYARTGAFSAEFEAALQQFTLHHEDDSLAAFEQLIAKLPKDDKSLYYARSCAAQLNVLKSLKTGKWVDLQPDAEMNGWSPLRGSWKVTEDGTVLAKPDENGIALMVFNGNLGARYEYQVEVEQTPPLVGNVRCGPVFEYETPKHFMAAPVSSNSPSVTICHEIGFWQHYPARTIDSVNTVRVQVYDDQMLVTVNDQPVRSEDRRNVPGVAHLGLMMLFGEEKDSVQFSGIRVRKLEKPPEKVKAAAEPE